MLSSFEYYFLLFKKRVKLSLLALRRRKEDD